MSFQRPGLCLLLAASLSWVEPVGGDEEWQRGGKSRGDQRQGAATPGAADHEDWPQWRGPQGTAVVADFAPPAQWPEQLTQKWKVTVGDGVATPAVVGDRLYVFARADGKEILRCLELASGTEVWQAAHAAQQINGPAGGFPGPRCSPAVAAGSVVVVGVHGDVACYDAQTGQERWRNSEFEGQVPRFYTSSSPLLFGERCIVQVGNDNTGGILCLQLADGKELWRWSGPGPDYASPTLAQIDGQPVVFAATSGKAVALHAERGTLLWEMDYQQGRYNATSPLVFGSLLILAGPNRGVTALQMKLEGDQLVANEAWRNEESTMVFSTPVSAGDWLFGLTGTNQLFCVNAQDGKTTWTAGGTTPAAGEAGGPPSDRPPSDRPPGNRGQGEQIRGGGPPRGDRANRPDSQEGPPGERSGSPPNRGGRGGGRGGRGGGRGGYGSVVAAGQILFSLTPAGELNVASVDGAEHKPLAKYKVAEGNTYAYPVIVNQHILIKDGDSVTVWGWE